MSTNAKQTTGQDKDLADWAYRAARHIRNTACLAPETWDEEARQLLREIREADPERYEREVKR